MSPRRRILYVAPNRELAENIAEILDEMGYEAEVAHDGQSAIELLPTCDLLLTEMDLPDLDALDLVRVTRRQRPDVPIVVFTAYTPDERLSAAEREGVNEILSFPFQPARLEQSLKGWLIRTERSSAG